MFEIRQFLLTYSAQKWTFLHSPWKVSISRCVYCQTSESERKKIESLGRKIRTNSSAANSINSPSESSITLH